MSVYNGEKYLKESIDSILNQTFRDFEFIIINDGSTDDSLNIIKKYHDMRIILLDSPKSGLMKSLNKGINIAKAEWIARMDADDISHTNRLEEQYTFIKENDGIVLFSSSYNIIDQEGRYLATRMLPTEDWKIREAMKTWNPICQPASVFKKSIFFKAGMYDEKINWLKKEFEDYALWREIIKFGKVGNIPQPLLDYRLTSVSNTNRVILSSSNEENKIELKDYFYNLRVGIALLEFGRNRKKARPFLLNSLKEKFQLSTFYNFILTFMPNWIVYWVKCSAKGKWYYA